jgi:haloalkane dehalogenase
MPAIARANRVIAIDLPGFGESDKPTDVTYGFGFFDAVLDGFTAELGLDRVGLAVHDLGGPIGLHWGMNGRVTRFAVLNTLVYPEVSPATVDFVLALSSPERRDELTSAAGLADVMRLGLADPARLTDEVIAAVRAPFHTDTDRLALAAAGVGLSLKGLADIARRLPSLDAPVRIVYGAQDRALPDVAETMARLAADLPTPPEVTVLPDCGHFLQEEAPERVGDLLAAFFRP